MPVIILIAICFLIVFGHTIAVYAGIGILILALVLSVFTICESEGVLGRLGGLLITFVGIIIALFMFTLV